MKKLLYTLIIFVTSVTVKGQQDPLYSQYMFNPVVLNPAYCGLYDMTSATIGTRYQWASFEGAPITYSGNFHTTLPIDNMGTGITVIHDQYGANSNDEVNLAFSYNIKTGYYSRFALGLQGGFIRNQFNRELVDFEDNQSDDPYFDYQKVMAPNFGFGVLYNSKKIFAGISVPKILKVNTTNSKGDSTISIYSPHYYLTGGTIIRLRDDLKLKPSTLIKIVEGVPLSVDFNTSILYRNTLWAGISFRNLNTFAVLGQIVYHDKMRFGFAYEIPTSKAILQSNKAFATFELMANFNFSIFDVQAVQMMYY